MSKKKTEKTKEKKIDMRGKHEVRKKNRGIKNKQNEIG